MDGRSFALSKAEVVKRGGIFTAVSREFDNVVMEMGDVHKET